MPGDTRFRSIGWRLTYAVALATALLAAGCTSSPSELTLSPDRSSTTADDQTAEQATTTSGDEETDGEAISGGPDLEGGVAEPSLIRIDQFGYRPGDPKIAVIVDPEIGYDADIDFTPGSSIEIRRWSDDEVVFEGSPEPWANGALHEQSGDRGWWFDFSELDEAGSYYIIDPESDTRSGPFDIGEDVYDEVLDAALRMFWYNRGNTPHPADLGGPWSDEAAYIGPGQDTEARLVDDQDNADTALDLSGGWFDAGDTNKYVSYASSVVHQLLTAYDRNPDVFDDEVGIPESGNGIPDVIDEVRWETDWLKKMQMEDGGVLPKVGIIEWTSPFPPSSSDFPRFYEEACSSSSIIAAGMFAHAALVYDSVPAMTSEADDLRDRAVDAWDWYQDSVKRDDCDAQIVKAGDADLSIDEQRDAAVVAAVYLFAATGDPVFESTIREDYAKTPALSGGGFGNYRTNQSDALLFYRELPSADAGLVADIDARIAGIVADSPVYGFDPEADLYRAFMPDSSYHWGSNMVKANIGSANLTVAGVPDGTNRALGHLHYFHGVNPLNLVYLSNMEALGAERSAQAIHHFWFGENTPFDVDDGSETGVAPGYLVGGPNRSYSGASSPPSGQPPMKSYLDSSGNGSEPIWEVTEPAISYQAAYVRLLAAVQASG